MAARRGAAVRCWRARRAVGRHGLAFAHDGDAVDDDGGEGFVVGVALDAGDGGDEQDGVGVALAEDGVLAVELGDGSSVMKNWLAVGAAAGGPGPALAMARRPGASKVRAGSISSWKK